MAASASTLKATLEQSSPNKALVPLHKAFSAISFTPDLIDVTVSFLGATIISNLGSYYVKQALASPWNLISQFGGMSYGDNHRFLHECVCSNFFRREIGKQSKLRPALETALIKQIVAKNPDRNAPLVLTSIGSGGCFQEMIILVRLIAEEGYSDIKLLLVDEKSSDKNLAAFIEKELKSLYPQLKVEITMQEDGVAYAASVKAGSAAVPHAVCMIDLDEHTDKVTQAVFACIPTRPRKKVVLEPTPIEKTVFAFTRGCAAHCLPGAEIIFRRMGGGYAPREEFGLYTEVGCDRLDK